MGSNLHKWDSYYESLDSPDHYGDTPSYEMGVDFLSSCDVVEDWGCGKGWFEHLVGDAFQVIALDGSATPFADKVVDLESYVSSVDGIFMRHVLEHNYNWKKILENALASFKKRFFLAIFTPMSDGDEAVQLAFVPGYEVPDLSLPESVVEDLIEESGSSFSKSSFKSNVAYGVETVYEIQKIQ
jgi:hypothetical protein